MGAKYFAFPTHVMKTHTSERLMSELHNRQPFSTSESLKHFLTVTCGLDFFKDLDYLTLLINKEG